MPHNATALWNVLAPGLRFDTTTSPEVNPTTKFGGAYHGEDFTRDFHQIVQGINAGLGTTAVVPPGYNGDDLMIESLLRFPPPSW